MWFFFPILFVFIILPGKHSHNASRNMRSFSEYCKWQTFCNLVFLELPSVQVIGPVMWSFWCSPEWKTGLAEKPATSQISARAMNSTTNSCRKMSVTWRWARAAFPTCRRRRQRRRPGLPVFTGFVRLVEAKIFMGARRRMARVYTRLLRHVPSSSTWEGLCCDVNNVSSARDNFCVKSITPS